MFVIQCFPLPVSADQLWGGVTGVSNAGRKRGRGKRVGRKRVTDLNKGQYIGDGKMNMQWPGLNVPVLEKTQIVKMSQKPEDPERQAKLVKLREKMSRGGKNAPPALERGWTGGSWAGMSLGPPDPINDCKEITTKNGL